MRALAVLLALGVSPAWGAADSEPAPPFPGYDELCGYEIVVWPTQHLSVAVRDGAMTPRIVVDPSLNAPKQAAHRIFLIAHECAHHRMKHTDKKGLRKRRSEKHGVRDQELSADCWAAEVMVDIGMSRQVLALADQFWRRGFTSPGQGYPSGIQRSNIIRHCARLKARSKMMNSPEENQKTGGSDE